MSSREKVPARQIEAQQRALGVGLEALSLKAGTVSLSFGTAAATPAPSSLLSPITGGSLKRSISNPIWQERRRGLEEEASVSKKKGDRVLC
jgi:hypothetical protein